jgi:DHA1 family bicyclomycin/chloramphenicol resistance-like MFS transporter
MVRDGAKGAAMARIMSFVMSVFMLVPVFAPTLGKLVVYYADWRFIFLGLLGASIIAGAWLELGQEETLAPENRRPFSAAQIWSGAIEVCSNRVSLGYTLATGMVFGVFTTYLSLCRRIYVDQYGLENAFPFIFGSLAICLAIAMIFNGNLVQRLGMQRLARRAMQLYVSVWTAVLLSGIVFGGQPPIYLLLGLFALWFFSAGFTFGNFSAMAMEPMGHIAGMAAAISGALSQGMGIVLAWFTGRFYNGTITSIAWFFVFYAIAAYAMTIWASAGRQVSPRPASADLPAAH